VVEVFVSGIRVGDWIEVRSSEEITKTLDQRGCYEGLPFMPEMRQFTGRRLRVQQCAGRTCVHPPQSPLPRLTGCFTLAGLRCDGSAHGGCQLGCMLFWKQVWLRPVDGPDIRSGPAPSSQGNVQRTGDGEAGTAAREAHPPAASKGQVPRVYTCQGTELARATTPGDPLWKPLPYLRLLRDGTYTAPELAGTLGRIASRRLTAMVLPRTSTGRTDSGDGVLGLRPGEWVKVKSSREIRQTLDSAGKLNGLAFGGDMVRDCGRTFRVRERIERIIDERNGRVRRIANTVVLEGSVCNHHLGCARGMPILWREAWLQRVATPDAAS
jgi:hypothetical protein